jgi:hypothetical protein
MNQRLRTIVRSVGLVTGAIALVLAGMSLTGASELTLVIPLLLLIASAGLLATSGRSLS